MSVNFAEQAWLYSAHYNDAMDIYQTHLATKSVKAAGDANVSSNLNLVNTIQETRNIIKDALKTDKSKDGNCMESRLESVELENKALKSELAELGKRFAALEMRLNNIDKPTVETIVEKKAEPVAEDDDDIDLFGSDEEEDEEQKRLMEERVADYQQRKKAKESVKGTLVAKSNIILDVKPWDDETDMAVLEVEVRKISTDGLLWGASKLVPVGYGIKKLQICCVVVDDKVGTDFLDEEITAIEDYVQSVDVVAFNKI